MKTIFILQFALLAGSIVSLFDGGLMPFNVVALALNVAGVAVMASYFAVRKRRLEKNG